MCLKPNSVCDDYNCRLKQKLAEAEPEDVVELKKEEDEIVHEDNEWGITLIDETPSELLIPSANEVLVEGLKRAYDAPIIQNPNSDTVEEVQSTLEDLMAKMKSI